MRFQFRWAQCRHVEEFSRGLCHIWLQNERVTTHNLTLCWSSTRLAWCRLQHWRERALNKSCFWELPTAFFLCSFESFFFFGGGRRDGNYNHFARRSCDSDTKLNNTPPTPPNPPLHLSDEIRASAARAVVFHLLPLFFFFIIKWRSTL